MFDDILSVPEVPTDPITFPHKFALERLQAARDMLERNCNGPAVAKQLALAERALHDAPRGFREMRTPSTLRELTAGWISAAGPPPILPRLAARPDRRPPAA